MHLPNSCKPSPVACSKAGFVLSASKTPSFHRISVYKCVSGTVIMLLSRVWCFYAPFYQIYPPSSTSPTSPSSSSASSAFSSASFSSSSSHPTPLPKSPEYVISSSVERGHEGGRKNGAGEDARGIGLSAGGHLIYIAITSLHFCSESILPSTLTASFHCKLELLKINFETFSPVKKKRAFDFVWILIAISKPCQGIHSYHTQVQYQPELIYLERLFPHSDRRRFRMQMTLDT